jgi:hypothetical protein
MKASQLIKELQDKIEQYGDCEVTYDTGVCIIRQVDDYWIKNPDPDGTMCGWTEPFFDLTR